MATADLALRVVAQVDQAIAGLRRLGEETKAVDSQAAQAQSTFGRWGDRLRGVGSSLGIGGAGAGGGGLGGLAAVVGGVAGGVVGAIGAQLASSISDAIEATVQRSITTAQQNLQQATSGQDIAQQISDVGRATGNAASPAAWWHAIRGGPGAAMRYVGDVFTGNTAGNAVFGGDPHRAQLDVWRDFVRAHPDQAAAALAGHAELGADYQNAYRQITGRTAANQQFAAQAAAQYPQIVINTGVGDPNAVGRAVRAAIDTRDRNNGQYVTTLSRR